MKKVCQIGFLKFGIGDYMAHLYPYLSKEFNLSIITFTHDSLGNKLVVNDRIVSSQIKKYQKIINPHGWKETKSSIVKLFDVFEKEKFDIFNLQVSTYTRHTAHIFIPIIEYFKKKGLKTIYTMHDVLPYPEKETVTEYLKYFYNLSDAAIVGNENEKINLAKYFSYKNRIDIAQHGVYSLFNTRRVDKKLSKSKLNLEKYTNIILFFGLLRDNKGLDIFIKSLDILNKKGFNFHSLISVSVRTNDVFNKYQKMINKYQLNNKVTVIAKYYANSEEIEDYFSASDVVVLPYNTVSQSGILNLSFAFEKPMIISDVFAEKDIINNKMGLIFPVKNYQKLASSIIDFFNKKTSYENIFIKNIKNYNLNHSFKQTSEIYINLFNKI